ncbi:MAG: FtsX-like permease family protein [Nibricoccus sp.]
MFRLLKYHVRSALVRWRTTVATVAGIAVVVWVFVFVQSLAVGIELASGNTGDPRNLLITRKGALAESTSIVTREQFNIIRYLPGVARGTSGTPIASADLLVIINRPRLNGSGNANVLVRGVSPAGIEMRPQAALVDGRWFRPGQREVVASRRLAARFKGLQVGSSFQAVGQTLTVVGLFDAQRSAFDSEVWMDADEARNVFDRADYGSILLRPIDEAGAVAFKKAIESDKRLKMKISREVDYYKEQTRTALLPRYLGRFLAVVMSIGAVFAAMNTLYASVGARTREVGTLRVLGFRRRNILFGFLVEGALLAGIGGAIGCVIAYLSADGYSVGTFGFETFSETVFDLKVTPALALRGFVFSLILGLVGSFLPALRASRLPVISSLKSA